MQKNFIGEMVISLKAESVYEIRNIEDNSVGD